MVTRTTNPGPAAGSLEGLALQADQLAAEPTEPQSAPSAEELAQQAEAAKAISAMELAATALIRKGLQAVRSRIARSLPEISHHWADNDLQALAVAAIPVGKKHLARLMPLLGDYPEEAALAVATLPLLLGYAAALTEHDQVRAGAVTESAPGNVVQLVPSAPGDGG